MHHTRSLWLTRNKVLSKLVLSLTVILDVYLIRCCCCCWSEFARSLWAVQVSLQTWEVKLKPLSCRHSKLMNMPSYQILHHDYFLMQPLWTRWKKGPLEAAFVMWPWHCYAIWSRKGKKKNLGHELICSCRYLQQMQCRLVRWEWRGAENFHERKHVVIELVAIRIWRPLISSHWGHLEGVFLCWRNLTGALISLSHSLSTLLYF